MYRNDKRAEMAFFPHLRIYSVFTQEEPLNMAALGHYNQVGPGPNEGKVKLKVLYGQDGDRGSPNLNLSL